MPNWVTAKLTIEGPNASKVMQGLLDKRENEVVFDFNKIIPMPKELQIVAGDVTDKCIDYYLATISEEGFNNLVNAFLKSSNSNYLKDKTILKSKDKIMELKEKLLENYSQKGKDYCPEPVLNTESDIIEYGKNALMNVIKYGALDWYEWSTKNWGTKWNACHNIYDEKVPNEIRFDTAWSDVRGLICELSKLYPDNNFVYEYAEEQIGLYTGQVCFQNGEMLYGACFEDNSKEAYELAFSLWGDSVRDWFEFDGKTNTYKLKEQNEDDEEME